MDVWMCTVKYNRESRLRERRGGGESREEGRVHHKERTHLFLMGEMGWL